MTSAKTCRRRRQIWSMGINQKTYILALSVSSFSLDHDLIFYPHSRITHLFATQYHVRYDFVKLACTRVCCCTIPWLHNIKLLQLTTSWYSLMRLREMGLCWLVWVEENISVSIMRPLQAQAHWLNQGDITLIASSGLGPVSIGTVTVLIFLLKFQSFLPPSCCSSCPALEKWIHTFA